MTITFIQFSDCALRPVPEHGLVEIMDFNHHSIFKLMECYLSREAALEDNRDSLHSLLLIPLKYDKSFYKKSPKTLILAVKMTTNVAETV